MSSEATEALVGAEVVDMLRTCRTCNIAKPLADFRHRVREDGTRYGHLKDDPAIIKIALNYLGGE